MVAPPHVRHLRRNREEFVGILPWVYRTVAWATRGALEALRRRVFGTRRFKVSPEAAWALTSGAVCLFLGVFTPSIFARLRVAPSGGGGAPDAGNASGADGFVAMLKPQAWRDEASAENLPSLWRATARTMVFADPEHLAIPDGKRAPPGYRGRAVKVHKISREPFVGLARQFASEDEVAALREAYPHPFAAYDALKTNTTSDGTAPRATWTVSAADADERVFETVLYRLHERLEDLARHPRGIVPRVEGGYFSVYDAGGAPNDAVALSPAVDANRGHLTVFLSDSPRAFPTFPFARELELENQTTRVGLEDEPAVGGSLYPCKLLLDGAADDDRDRLSVRIGRGGADDEGESDDRPYREGLRRDVDYDVADADRYEAIYADAVKASEGGRRGGLRFGEAIKREADRGGDAAALCAWLVFHRYQRICETHAHAHLRLRAGDAVFVRADEAAGDLGVRPVPRETGAKAGRSEPFFAPPPPRDAEHAPSVGALRGLSCGAAPRITYTAFVRSSTDPPREPRETNATDGEDRAVVSPKEKRALRDLDYNIDQKALIEALFRAAQGCEGGQLQRLISRSCATRLADNFLDE